MSKNYAADKVNNLLLRIRFATPSDPVQKLNSDDEENQFLEYYAAVQKLQCWAKNGTMKAPVVAEKYLGSSKSRPWIAKEVGDAIKGFSTLNTSLYNDLKEMYTEAISEDIT